MNSEITPQTDFPALPVRRRETLEIFDTALKLFRRYFWVLMGWSALVAVMSLIPFINWFSVFFVTPLLYGAVSCCVAAAVRGQKVRFSQCWSFTKPRYSAMLGVVFLSYLVLMGVFLALYIGSILIGLLGYWALSSAPQPVQIVAMIVGGILATVAFSGVGVFAFGWMNMAPIIACLEDDKRGTAAMSRAFELLKGNWGRVFSMSLILGLAILAVFGIIGGVYALVVGLSGLREFFGANPSEGAMLGVMGTFGAFMGLVMLIWTPAQSLVISVLYLDLRVRREALDLEWTAYASAPPSMPLIMPPTTPSIMSAPEFSELAPQMAPAEFDFLRPTPNSDAASGAVSNPEAPVGALTLAKEPEQVKLANENASSSPSFAAGNATGANSNLESSASSTFAHGNPVEEFPIRSAAAGISFARRDDEIEAPTSFAPDISLGSPDNSAPSAPIDIEKTENEARRD